MAEQLRDLGESWVQPEVLAAEVAVKKAVHLRTERENLGVVAHDVSPTIQRKLAPLQPVLLKVEVELVEQLRTQLPVVGVHEPAVA